MNKVVRDGKVAVLVSGGYGAGWSTWCYDERAETMMFHPKLVKAVEEERFDDLEEIAISLFDRNEVDEDEGGDVDVPYLGGVDGLRIVWVPEGAMFRINEYDGAESLEIFDPDNFVIA